MTDYLVLFAIVLGVNLMPAFGPPTWTIIVLYGLNTQMPVPAIVLVGAAGAATGRFLLALSFRLLADYVPDKVKRNVTAVRDKLMEKKRTAVIGLGVFALSPVPSAQLFEAAGLSKLPLVKFTAAFFAGRLVSYAIYAAGAKGVAKSSIGDAFRHAITSPVGIAVQLSMIALLVAFTQIDWEKWLKPGSATAKKNGAAGED